MDEFVAAGETLQSELGLENAFYMRGDAYWLQPYLWAFGGGLFEVNEEGQVTEILVNNEGSVAGLEFLLNDVLGTIAPADVDFPNDYANAMTAFKEGDVAMIFNGPWSTADVLSGAEFTDPENLGVAVIPAGPDGDQGLADRRPQLRRVCRHGRGQAGMRGRVHALPQLGGEPGAARDRAQPAPDPDERVRASRGRREPADSRVRHRDRERHRATGRAGGRRDLHRLRSRTSRPPGPVRRRRSKRSTTSPLRGRRSSADRLVQ